jgi:hypothetical protein
MSTPTATLNSQSTSPACFFDSYARPEIAMVGRELDALLARLKPVNSGGLFEYEHDFALATPTALAEAYSFFPILQCHGAVDACAQGAVGD